MIEIDALTQGNQFVDSRKAILVTNYWDGHQVTICMPYRVFSTRIPVGGDDSREIFHELSNLVDFILTYYFRTHDLHDGDRAEINKDDYPQWLQEVQVYECSPDTYEIPEIEVDSNDWIVMVNRAFKRK